MFLDHTVNVLSHFTVVHVWSSNLRWFGSSPHLTLNHSTILQPVYDFMLASRNLLINICLFLSSFNLDAFESDLRNRLKVDADCDAVNFVTDRLTDYQNRKDFIQPLMAALVEDSIEVSICNKLILYVLSRKVMISIIIFLRCLINEYKAYHLIS